MNKRGSYIVFVSIFFSAILVLIMAVIYYSGQVAISETTETFGRSWARSIISEYDRELLDRYGIRAYYGDKKTVEDKINILIDYSYKEKSYINVSDLFLDIEPYSMTNLENFESEVNFALKHFRMPKKIQNEIEEVHSNRYILADWIIKGLPSNSIKVDKNWKLTLDDAYIFRFFKDYVNTRNLKETYFRNEIEYIISGKLDDNKARNSVKTKLSTMLEAQNYGYLLRCPEKKNSVLTIATILCPEDPYAVYYGLLATWAACETSNDIKILYDEGKVPLLKSDENWATNIWSCIFGESSGKGYISPKRMEGKDYDGYLDILLKSIPASTKELRMMDLIEINLRFTYCDYFSFSDYYTGLYYSMKVNGKLHEFETDYEKQAW